MKKTVVLTIILVVSLVMFLGCAATDELSTSLSESYSDSPEGTYVAELPSASGMGRMIVLHLFENGNAIRTNIYIGEPDGDYVEEGKWVVERGEVNLEPSHDAPDTEHIRSVGAGRVGFVYRYDPRQ